MSTVKKSISGFNIITITPPSNNGVNVTTPPNSTVTLSNINSTVVNVSPLTTNNISIESLQGEQAIELLNASNINIQNYLQATLVVTTT